ncbi:hypothetical protein BVC80_7763g3 [Macleaya cordata]|uniref:Uncharacterized protein n=1 Tax=Macleaya cordata TaxID=56857 RepID=A0A200QGA4_MACCD|nr:hypothetical protein BVC80_7763g3 [Macleaya cordata]
MIDESFNSKFPNIYKVTNSKHFKIADMFVQENNGFNWSLNFSRRLYDHEIREVEALLLVLQEFQLHEEDSDSRFMEDAGYSLVVPNSFEDLMFQWRFKLISPRGNLIMEMLPAVIVWNLWLERNQRVFGREELELGKLIINIKIMEHRWVSLQDPFKGANLDSVVVRWKEFIFEPH